MCGVDVCEHNIDEHITEHEKTYPQEMGNHHE
jgi:hypothetical protein